MELCPLESLCVLPSPRGYGHDLVGIFGTFSYKLQETLCQIRLAGIQQSLVQQPDSSSKLTVLLAPVTRRSWSIER